MTDASSPNASSVLLWGTSLYGEDGGETRRCREAFTCQALSHLCISLPVLSPMLKSLYQLLIVPLAQRDRCTKLGFPMPLHPSFKCPNESSVILVSDYLSFWYQATVKDQSCLWENVSSSVLWGTNINSSYYVSFTIIPLQWGIPSICWKLVIILAVCQSKEKSVICD